MSTGAPGRLGLQLDPNALTALRSQGRDAPEAALRGAAKQFEALFLDMMLKGMRQTVPQDGALDSDQTRMFTGMLDEQYASQLAQGHGMGLADMLVRQLGRSLPARRAGPEAADRTSASDPGAGAAAAGSAADAAPAVSAFRARLGDAAQAASAATGIPADFMLAQAGLESGWGRHQPVTAEGAPSHNLFGIKAGPHWHGAVASAMTTEVVDGVARRVQQNFRAYASYAEAFQDYASLLSGNARYARARGADSAQAFAGALQQAGYATDPGYAGKVERAIRQVTDLRA